LIFAYRTVAQQGKGLAAWKTILIIGLIVGALIIGIVLAVVFALRTSHC
jgi:hypothetical protein